MRLTRRWVLAWLLLVLVLPASGAEIDTGLLWRVESAQGRISYLFGTMHTHDARVTTFSPALESAIAQCDLFMPELASAGSPAMLFLPTGTLRDHLNGEELELLLQRADAYAMRESIALRTKPWLLAVMLGRPDASGLPTLDELLVDLATRKGRKIEGLEDASLHFAAMDGLAMTDQLALLRVTLKQTQEEKQAAFEQVLDAYLTRRATQVAAMDERLSGEALPPGLWAKVRKLLIDDRNARMAERMISRMQQASVFVAVGASHLPGEGGLVTRLRQAGYRVEAIE